MYDILHDIAFIYELSHNNIENPINFLSNFVFITEKMFYSDIYMRTPNGSVVVYRHPFNITSNASVS